MAQTTTAFSKANFKVEVSTNGTAWTDISGAAATVTVTGGDQLVGEQNTADGDAPVVTHANKVESRQVEVNCLYTETASQPWKVVAAQYNGASKVIFLRYSPAGGNTGDIRFTCARDDSTAIAAPIVNCMPPDLDAGTGDPAMFTFTVQTPKLNEETIS